MTFLALDILHSGVMLSMFCAGAGLLFAIFLIKAITSRSPGNERMREIAGAVEEGAKAYLRRQVMTISAIAVVIFVLLLIFMKEAAMATGVGFLIGAFCSLAAGYIGMRIAVLANVRTAQAASSSRTLAMRVAFNGGAVTGLLVVGLALLSVAAFYSLAVNMVGPQLAVRSLIGLALGASLISVFARLGGGIYTKAADVGADLVGKIESNLDEDDPRNPATIADNVGDNVGDCAGMAADVFETYAVSLIGAILVGALTLGSTDPDIARAAIVYPFILGGISVLGAILGIIFVNISNLKPGTALMGAVGASALVSAILFYPATHLMFPNGVTVAGLARSANALYLSALVGVVLTFVVVLITNYYTSTAYRPVRKIAKASETGHATNIIAGLAIGQHATALPVVFIGLAILSSYHFAGLYGIAIAVMSMLSMAGIIISLDAFGPITDNAGGIAVMSNLPKEVRGITDELDAGREHHESRHQRLRHRFGGAGCARPLWLLCRRTKGALRGNGPRLLLRFFAQRSEGDHWSLHWRLAALYLHRVQHGCSGQSGRRGRAWKCGGSSKRSPEFCAVKTSRNTASASTSSRRRRCAK